METLTKRWETYPRLSAEEDLQLSAFPPILRQVLANRGYRTDESARAFLKATVPEGTHPSAMYGMQAAAERIAYAIRRAEPLAVYGDYDVDGVTATALLTQALTALGAEVRPYIPNRFEEGYGLNNEALDTLAGEGIRLVVTVDCGVRSLAEAEHATALGIDLIISDHHQPGAEIPRCCAVINPRQPACAYPDKDLAGVGLAYKLAYALFELLDPNPAFTPPGARPLNGADDYLDLVALGTVADLAPLTGENRALVREGLKRLRQPKRQGLLSLIGVAGVKPQTLSASDIGFMLGPRLNAAGRLDSALAALDLLTTSDLWEAGRLAQQLNVQNYERQMLTRQIQARAEEIALAEDPEALILIAADPGFNTGVVGLAASRLTEKFYRPSIVAQIGESYTRGSCRSIPEFHITQALDRCAGMLERHGGHAAAAGFTVRNERLPEFNACLKEIAAEILAGQDLRPVVRADMEVPLHELTPELYKALYYLQPTGHQNPEPRFISTGLQVRNSRTVGKDASHLKLAVSDGRLVMDAIAFRQGHWQQNMPQLVDLLYTFETNEFNGRISYQLNVQDIRPAVG